MATDSASFSVEAAFRGNEISELLVMILDENNKKKITHQKFLLNGIKLRRLGTNIFSGGG